MNACEIELGRAYIGNVTRQVYPRPVGVVGYPFSLRRKRPVFKSRTGRHYQRCYDNSINPRSMVNDMAGDHSHEGTHILSSFPVVFFGSLAIAGIIAFISIID